MDEEEEAEGSGLTTLLRCCFFVIAHKGNSVFLWVDFFDGRIC